MASSIQFMRGLQAKVNAANIKDGQPALVRRSGKSPLLFIGNGAGAGKAVQIAPDVDVYGNLGVTSGQAFYIRRNTDNANNWSQIYFDKLDDAQYAGVFYPYHTVNVDLGKESNRFRNTYTRTLETKQINVEDTTSIIGSASQPFSAGYISVLNSVSRAVPVSNDTGTIGTAEARFASGYFYRINAQSEITTAGTLTAGTLTAGSSTVNGTLTATGAIRSGRPADTNSRIFNIFSDAAAPAADTTAYGTATQLVTYYKNGANAEPTPHYLRFQATSDTSAQLTFSRGATGDTVGIGSGELPFDWLYAKNVYSIGLAFLCDGATVTGTIAPSFAGGAMLGTSTNRFGDCYFGNITVGSVTPINGTSYSLGTSTNPFATAHVNGMTIYSSLNPDTSGGATLGSSTLPWGTAYLGSTYTYSITPRTDSSYTLGSSSVRWSTIYGDTVNVATGIVPDANTGAYIGTSSNRFATSYFSTLNVSTGLEPDSAGGAYVGTSSKYMSTSYFSNLYIRGSTAGNRRVPVIQYGSDTPANDFIGTPTNGDVYIQYGA